MRVFTSSVLVLGLALPCGCSMGGVGADQKALNAQLRGLTLGEAVQQLGLEPGGCAVFDEPPGVARGISAKLADSRTVKLWLARQDGLFRENRDWTIQQIAGRRVAAVDVRE
jgi:hypothetical protein